MSQEHLATSTHFDSSKSLITTLLLLFAAEKSLHYIDRNVFFKQKSTLQCHSRSCILTLIHIPKSLFKKSNEDQIGRNAW
jgi:hypothetical protein